MKKLFCYSIQLFLLCGILYGRQMNLSAGIPDTGQFVGALRDTKPACDSGNHDNNNHQSGKLIENSGNDESDLATYFQSFAPLEDEDRYTVALCADVPDNNNPDRIHVRDEPGHTFLILTKKNVRSSSPAITRVFGFYPHRPASCLIFRNVRGEIMDNGGRQYDATLSVEITATAFRAVLAQSQLLARKKYNLNKFNCYDYSIGVFNSINGVVKLPVTHLKFPFIFGRGGTPCGLYRDLEKLKKEDSVWAPHIQFGIFYAPRSNPDLL
jgi:hypothetical protein